MEHGRAFDSNDDSNVSDHGRAYPGVDIPNHQFVDLLAHCRP
jgi:hypothetical protein